MLHQGRGGTVEADPEDYRLSHERGYWLANGSLSAVSQGSSADDLGHSGKEKVLTSSL